jgi:hypothetical protein
VNADFAFQESKLEKRDKLRGRDYKRLITKVEKIGQRLDTIREKNPEKAGQIENNIKWERALKRASGVVVKVIFFMIPRLNCDS